MTLIVLILLAVLQGVTLWQLRQIGRVVMEARVAQSEARAFRQQVVREFGSGGGRELLRERLRARVNGGH